MRLFIAVMFNDEIKTGLTRCLEDLKSISEKGNFIKPENLHLTLVFIGETNDFTAVKNVLDKIDGKSFNISIFGLGKFKRYGGGTYWVGVNKSNELDRLYDALSSSLISEGFNLDKRDFKPHITLGREVKIPDKTSVRIPAMSMQVNKISIMKSERVNGKLTYTEVYGKELNYM
jgi:2'-5' RNA ligase